jgi:hypothetical protein
MSGITDGLTQNDLETVYSLFWVEKKYEDMRPKTKVYIKASPGAPNLDAVPVAELFNDDSLRSDLWKSRVTSGDLKLAAKDEGVQEVDAHRAVIAVQSEHLRKMCYDANGLGVLGYTIRTDAKSWTSLSVWAWLVYHNVKYSESDRASVTWEQWVDVMDISKRMGTQRAYQLAKNEVVAVVTADAVAAAAHAHPVEMATFLNALGKRKATGPIYADVAVEPTKKKQNTSTLTAAAPASASASGSSKARANGSV